ncbi:hypothetical protein KTH_49050 [Thermosporothrix hazakensis]|nr:hypothetical protein KTH_49050 [Thermosporothrix hazakensis]
MKTVKIYQLNALSYQQFQRCKAAQMESAQIWNVRMEMHKTARMGHTRWPGRNALHQATRGRFALHSQSVQQVFTAFLATIETTSKLRQRHPQMQMKYPWRTKRFYPVKWPAQAVSRERGRVVLPMGKGRPSLVLPLDLPENSGACSLVWNNGFELHVCVEQQQAEEAPGTVQATVDLGGNPPGGCHHQHSSGHDRDWARDPLPQTAEEQAPGSACEKAIQMQALFAPMEEAATRQKQAVSSC